MNYTLEDSALSPETYLFGVFRICYTLVTSSYTGSYVFIIGVNLPTPLHIRGQNFAESSKWLFILEVTLLLFFIHIFMAQFSSFVISTQTSG